MSTTTVGRRPAAAPPTTCQAAVLVDYGKPLELREVPVPEEIEPGGILVQIDVATICGSDIHLVDGDIAVLTSNLPLIPGHEFVGKVVKTGRGAERDSLGRDLKYGDRIVWEHENCGHCYACVIQGDPGLCSNRRQYMIGGCSDFPYLTGGLAEYCYVFPKSGRLLVPDAVKSEWASAASCAGRTVFRAFERLGRIAPSETVVIQGSGPLGLFATALARRSGAGKIVVIGAPEQRLALAREWGADETVAVGDTTPESRAERVREFTLGEGADIVMEFSGGRGAFKEGIGFTRTGGRYVVVGQLGPAADEIQPSLITRNALTIMGSWSATISHYWQAMDFIERTRHELDYDALTTSKYELADANTAIERMHAFRDIKPAIYPGGIPG